MDPSVEFEVSSLAAPGQLEKIFSSFDALASPRTLELLFRTPPEASQFLAQFQNRYAHGFDWWPLDSKADGFRVLIARRDPEPRTIAHFLGSDHQRLNAYWQEFLQAVGSCEKAYELLFVREEGHRFAAVHRLSQFTFGLRRHIRMEEDLLFPAFDDRSRMPAGSGPTAVMRAEHREIEELLRNLEKLLTGGDCATVIQTIEGRPVHPSTLLSSHDAKEEKVLYPMADRLFTQAEKDDLCLKMQRL
jgi:hemerythrin-like domain-containing protein